MLERLGRMHENKTFFKYVFLYALAQIGYFNTGFVKNIQPNINPLL